VFGRQATLPSVGEREEVMTPQETPIAERAKLAQRVVKALYNDRDGYIDEYAPDALVLIDLILEGTWYEVPSTEHAFDFGVWLADTFSKDDPIWNFISNDDDIWNYIERDGKVGDCVPENIDKTASDIAAFLEPPAPHVIVQVRGVTIDPSSRTDEALARALGRDIADLKIRDHIIVPSDEAIVDGKKVTVTEILSDPALQALTVEADKKGHVLDAHARVRCQHGHAGKQCEAFAVACEYRRWYAPTYKDGIAFDYFCVKHWYTPGPYGDSPATRTGIEVT